MILSKMFTLFLACLMLASLTLAQPAPPTANVLTRTLMIESPHGRGSVFSLDVDEREYWITAKHVLTGAEHPPYGSITNKSVSLRILNPGAQGEEWLSVNFSVIDVGEGVDIVVLAAPHPILDKPGPSPATTAEGVMMGADCEFLGYPFGGGWRATWDDGHSYWMPFTKRCLVSTLTFGEPKIYVLDGINNKGFSGGPVVYRTGNDQKIIAVVSGYITEPAEVISSVQGKPVAIRKPSRTPNVKPSAKETVNMNSGFIIAYAISPAIDAIHKNPIGPLRVASDHK